MAKNDQFRSEKTLLRRKAYQERGGAGGHFDDWRERTVMEFERWALILNLFPFDMIAEAHHLLIPKRKVAASSDLDPREREELEIIKQKIAPNYDWLLENFPHNRSVRDHYHLHCIRLINKDEEDIKGRIFV